MGGQNVVADNGFCARDQDLVVALDDGAAFGVLLARGDRVELGAEAGDVNLRTRWIPEDAFEHAGDGVEDKAWRAHPEGCVFARAVGFLIDGVGNGAQARDVGLSGRGVGDVVAFVEEGGQCDEGAVHLIDDIRMRATQRTEVAIVERGGAGDAGELIAQDGVGELIIFAETADIERAKFCIAADRSAAARFECNA